MFISSQLFSSKPTEVFGDKSFGCFIYVDTDETIKVDDKPNMLLIGYLRRLRQLHPEYTIVLWSRAGQDHAMEVATEFDLRDVFDHVLAKPTWLFDDAGVAWDKHIKVLPPDGEMLLHDDVSSIDEYIGEHSRFNKPPLFD